MLGPIRARDLARELLHARTRSLASLGMTISSEMGSHDRKNEPRAIAGDDQLMVPGAEWLAAVVPRRWSRRRRAPPGLQSTLGTAVMVRLSRFMGRRRFVGYPGLGERRLVLPSCGVRSMSTKLSRDCQPGLPRYRAARGSECSEARQRACVDRMPWMSSQIASATSLVATVYLKPRSPGAPPLPGWPRPPQLPPWPP